MTYLDSSVLLRLILGQPDSLPIAALEPCISSQLLDVECHRTLDRLRLARGWQEAIMRPRREALVAVLRSLQIVPLAPAILARACAPLHVPLGTLEAFHLATVLRLREETEEDLRLATHDRMLADAAKAHGLEVVGV